MSWVTKEKWIWFGDYLLCPLDEMRLIVLEAGGVNMTIVGPMADKLWANEVEGVWWVGATNKLRQKSYKSKRFMPYKNKAKKTLNGADQIPVVTDNIFAKVRPWPGSLEPPRSTNNIELWRPIGTIKPGEIGVLRKS